MLSHTLLVRLNFAVLCLTVLFIELVLNLSMLVVHDQLVTQPSICGGCGLNQNDTFTSQALTCYTTTVIGITDAIYLKFREQYIASTVGHVLLLAGLLAEHHDAATHPDAPRRFVIWHLCSYCLLPINLLFELILIASQSSLTTAELALPQQCTLGLVTEVQTEVDRFNSFGGIIVWTRAGLAVILVCAYSLAKQSMLQDQTLDITTHPIASTDVCQIELAPVPALPSPPLHQPSATESPNADTPDNESALSPVPANNWIQRINATYYISRHVVGHYVLLGIMVVLIEIFLNLALTQNGPLEALPAAFVCTVCNLSPQATILGDEYAESCFASTVNGIQRSTFLTFFQNFITTAVGHVLVIMGFLRENHDDANRKPPLPGVLPWHLASYIILPLDLIAELAVLGFLDLSNVGVSYPTRCEGEVGEVQDAKALMDSLGRGMLIGRTLVGFVTFALFAVARQRAVQALSQPK
eukprot:c17483_g2_i1.p1 GENE.c17483_g2_i1~~c17483_g2_i1.p1  ORF type:complete len:470 (+),score=93.03 c17483_g2_i1:26-1435(+)